MSTPGAADPHWVASDLLEHARRLTALAAQPPGPARSTARVVDGVRELHASCVRLETQPLAGRARARDRERLLHAFDGLACASDDLAAIVLLRCTDPADAGEDAGSEPDLPALLERVAERHDRVVALLGRAGVRRTTMS
jgi:hypothetical protein